MPISEARRRANEKYNAKAYDQIQFRVKKGQKQVIQAHTFAFLNVNIIPAISFIGVVTFTCSAIGVKIGNIFGLKYKSKAEIAGGVILILLGCKILIEHLGIL